MADLGWSYGESVVIEKDASPDPTWSYGESWLLFEESGLSISGFFGSTLSPKLPLIKGVNL